MTESASRTTVRGVMSMGSGTLVVSVLRLGVLAILARLLTPADFGVVGAALILSGVAEAVFMRGIAEALIQRPVLERRQIDTALVASLVAGFGAASLLVLFAPYADDLFGIEGVAPALRALSLVFPLNALAVIARAKLRRDLEFPYLARVEVISYVVGYGAVAVISASVGLGVWALVFGTLGRTTVMVGLMLVKHPPQFPRHPAAAAFRELFKFSSGYTLGELAFYTAQRVDDFGVARWLGPAALGVYGRAYQLMADPGDKLGAVLQNVLFPTMAKLQTDTRRLAGAYVGGASVVALVMLPVGAVFAILGDEVIGVLLGEQWLDAVTPFKILAVGMVFRTSFNLSESVAKAVGAVYRRAWRQWAYAILVLLAVWLGHAHGLNGVAVGVTIAMGINFLLMAGLALRVVGASWLELLRAHAAPGRLTVILVAAAWPMTWLMRSIDAPDAATLAVVLIAAATLAMGAILLLPRVFSVPELSRLVSVLRRTNQVDVVAGPEGS